MADKLKRLRSEVHRHQWRQTLQDYAYPKIGHKPVDQVGTDDVLAVLRPIWETKCETAARLRVRIERILARATVEGHRSGSNPATWRGHLQEALPKPSEVKPVVHHPAMEFHDLPTFMTELGRRAEVGAAALGFLILTAARTSEVTGAQWPEINWADKTWTVPGVRSKTGRDHVVPLSSGAIAIPSLASAAAIASPSLSASAQSVVAPAASQAASPAVHAIERVRRAVALFDSLYDELDLAEENASDEHGRRPFALIACANIPTSAAPKSKKRAIGFWLTGLMPSLFTENIAMRRSAIARL